MRKTRIRFFTIADFVEEEKWLRDQHRNGWKILKMTFPCFYIFESCEPQDVIYRLDFKNSGQTEDYMQMLNDYGWEYFEHCCGWLYFRRPAETIDTEEDGELFSDDTTRVEMVNYIIKTRLVPLAIIFLCCIIPNLINAVSHKMGIFNELFGCIFGILFVIYVVLILHCGTKLKKMKNG